MQGKIDSPAFSFQNFKEIYTAMDEKLISSFEYALETQNMEMFNFLLKDYGAFKKKDKEELLKVVALKSLNSTFVKRFLELGADINYRDEDGNTLLHYAAASCHPEVVQFLIEKGLSVDARNNSQATPLCVAAKETSSLKIVKILVEAGSDINVRSNHGETLLITSAGLNPETKISKYFISLGLSVDDVDEDGYTPLLNAALWQENTDVIDLLVEAGADIRATAKNGDTMFHLASMNHSPYIASYIESYFLVSETNNEGQSCMQYALLYAKNPYVLDVYLHKQRLENVMYACMNHDPSILECLIQSGYDVNASDSHGMTAMMMAARHNTELFIIFMLLNHNAIYDCYDENGRNVLHYAASNSDSTIYDYMSTNDKFKKLVNVKDEFGHLPEYYRSHPAEF